jgi:hypothetical protein
MSQIISQPINGFGERKDTMMLRAIKGAVATAALAVAMVPAAASAASPHAAGSGLALRSAVSARISHSSDLSQGLQAWLNGPVSAAARRAATPALSTKSNVDAANVGEDTASGQSETAIAAQRGAGGRSLVMTGWNDATGLTYTDTTQLPSSITGIGFSGDGGRSFRDLVGLPNKNIDQQWFGDPTVAALGDGRHFVVGSLYMPSLASCSDGLPAQGTVAVSVATVNAAGTGATFTPPVVVAQAGNLCALLTNNPPPNIATLDKDFLSYDPASRTLAVSYTRFYITGTHSGLGQIEVARAHVPVSPTALSAASFGTPITVWPEEQGCAAGAPSSEHTQCGAANQGAYPTVAPGGDVYVAWERNIDTNLGSNGDPYVYEHAARIPAGSNAVAIGGPAHPVVVSAGQPHGSPDHLGVKSLDATSIVGYSRGIGNDFPRLAFDPVAHAVVFVWNDASNHPLGDIWLRSASATLTTLGPVQRVNDDNDFALHFLPAISVRANGTICTSWYDRRLGGPVSTVTDYYGECRPNPTSAASDFRITTGSTDWAGTSSLINPNFGDYTDNATNGTTTFFTWSDGRLGIPQPFVDHR